MSRLRVGAGTAWLLAWGTWLLTGMLLPLPPWRVANTLEIEERRAAELAGAAPAYATWSIDVGGARQAEALEEGWGVPEAFVEDGQRRSFAWVTGEGATLRVPSPGWNEATLTLAAAPLDELAPLAVEVRLDGAPRAQLVLERGWSLQRVAIGAVPKGGRRLELRARAAGRPAAEPRRLSLAVDGLAVGAPVAEPARDRGVFTTWLAVALVDRPALVVSREAPLPRLPEAAARTSLGPDLQAFYAFDGGRPAPGAAALAVVHGLATAVVVLLLPGLLWSARGAAQGPARLTRALAGSALALLVVLVLLRALGVAPSPAAVASGLALASGLGAVRARGRDALRLDPATALVGAVALAALVVFAVRLVPPLEDQDMELQVTAPALVARQTPLALTNRGTPHFFAHPPLLHLATAGGFALAGELGRLEPHAQAGREALARGAPARDVAFRQELDARWTRLLSHFLAEPRLWPTRRGNVLLAALAWALLALLAHELTGRREVAVGLALLGLSQPELLVRGAYGGYFAITALATLLVLAALASGAGAAGAAALAALANQKGLLAPAGWALVAPRGSGAERWRPLAAALLALAAFAAWGLGVDAASFRADFLRDHVVARLVPSAREAPAAGYPSASALWLEFAARYGWLFLLAAAATSVRGLRDRRPAVRAAAAAVLLGAVVFSLTDWRQTKHLALLVPPALVALAGAWPLTTRGHRVALALLLVALGANLARVATLVADFEAWRPAAGW